MSFWKRLFGDRGGKAPSLSDPGFSSFLLGWECELRSSATPIEELVDELPERFFEHFPDTFDEPTTKRLLVELSAWTERFVAEEKTNEESWSTATGNDRLTAAFEMLRERDLVALEDAGVSIQDGWGGVGLRQRRQHRGAVFFHQQDVLDAIRGDELLLAFGAFEERPGAPSSEAIGQEVMEALTAHGLSPSWSGDASERIRLKPFPWQKRRWTPSPDVSSNIRPGPTFVRLDKQELLTPHALRPEKAGAFSQRVTAVRSSSGFNVRLSDAFRDLWKQHGGARGQLCHIGPPHVFVPAGEQTELGVRNAYLNLDPAEAAAVRRRARGIVIAEKRKSVVRATPWSRSLWAPGGGPGRVGLIVVSDAPLSQLARDESPVDLSEWSPYAEMPDQFSWVYQDRQTQPERFFNLLEAARAAHLHTTTGPSQAVLDQVERARYGAFIQCEVPDPADLGYLQFGWAVARWLLERGDGAVLDTHAGRWWTRDELAGWEAGGWPTGRRFLVQRELTFTSGIAEGKWVLGTEGLRKFGRPELLCSLIPERLDTSTGLDTASIPAWGPEALEFFATRLALGAQLRPGEELTFGTMEFAVEPYEAGVNAPAGAPEESIVLVRPPAAPFKGVG